MRETRLLIILVAALAAGACSRQQPTYYVLDPNTRQPVPAVTQPQYVQQGYGQPAYRPPSPMQSDRGLYSLSPAYAQQAYDQPPYVQQADAQPSYQPPVSGERGLFAPGGPFAAQPQYAVAQGGPYVAAPNADAQAAPQWSRSGDPYQ